MSSVLPYEIITLVLEKMEPEARFRASVCLRRLDVRDRTVPSIPRLSLDSASMRGRIDILEWWRVRLLANVSYLDGWDECGWTTLGMDLASSAGNLQVLDWWHNSGLECRWSHRALDWASHKGHLDVLNWWSERYPNLKYSHEAVDMACAAGHIQTLDWWKRYTKKRGQPLVFSENAFLLATITHRHEIVEWLKDFEV